jgi:hypothetical protein
MRMNDMTLGDLAEALQYGEWACACSGPGPWPNCGCGWFWRDARQLQRAAHITAKLIADYAARKADR